MKSKPELAFFDRNSLSFSYYMYAGPISYIFEAIWLTFLVGIISYNVSSGNN